MSAGATSILPTVQDDDLWETGEPWHVTIDISNLENMVADLESEIAATAGERARDVTSDHLSKIWSIDRETAKQTIGLTTQYVRHEESDHLSR